MDKCFYEINVLTRRDNHENCRALSINILSHILHWWPHWVLKPYAARRKINFWMVRSTPFVSKRTSARLSVSYGGKLSNNSCECQRWPWDLKQLFDNTSVGGYDRPEKLILYGFFSMIVGLGAVG